MRLPRDLSGDQLARLLRRRYGYRIILQRGSHIRLARDVQGDEFFVTVPRHKELSIGTLGGILSDVSEHLGITQDELRGELFGD